MARVCLEERGSHVDFRGRFWKLLMIAPNTVTLKSMGVFSLVSKEAELPLLCFGTEWVPSWSVWRTCFSNWLTWHVKCSWRGSPMWFSCYLVPHMMQLHSVIDPEIYSCFSIKWKGLDFVYLFIRLFIYELGRVAGWSPPYLCACAVWLTFPQNTCHQPGLM